MIYDKLLVLAFLVMFYTSIVCLFFFRREITGWKLSLFTVMLYAVTAFAMMLTSRIGTWARSLLLLCMSTDTTLHFDLTKNLKRGPLRYRFGAKKQDIFDRQKTSETKFFWMRELYQRLEKLSAQTKWSDYKFRKRFGINIQIFCLRSMYFTLFFCWKHHIKS